MLRHLFSDPYVCTIVIAHASYSINIVYTNRIRKQFTKLILIRFLKKLNLQSRLYAQMVEIIMN